MNSMRSQPESVAVSATSESLRVIPLRRPGRWAAMLVILALLAMLTNSLVTNERFEWNVVGEYFFSDRVLRGLVLTLELTIIAMAIGTALGIVLAIMRLSPNPVIVSVSSCYIWFFRGTPLLVQLIFWFNLAALYPRLGFGIPFGPQFITVDANAFITPFLAAVLALGLNQGAYMSEIVRAGLLSVDDGQTEAAQALGMNRLMTLRRIVLPQAMRVIIPPTGNETISMLKTTSLVSVISVTELLRATQLIYAANYKTIPLLIVASIWYLLFTSLLTVIQSHIERRFTRGLSRTLPLTRRQRLVMFTRNSHSATGLS